MYGNLRDELRKKNISQKTVAELIGCSERTLRNKIRGESDLTVSEAFAIQRSLFPECNMDYVFATTGAGGRRPA